MQTHLYVCFLILHVKLKNITNYLAYNFIQKSYRNNDISNVSESFIEGLYFVYDIVISLI